MKIISFLYKLLFNKKRTTLSDEEPELFYSDDYLRPEHENFHRCPKCKIEANTNKEAIDMFGVRTHNGKPSIQSWCRTCRNNDKDNITSPNSSQEKINI